MAQLVKKKKSACNPGDLGSIPGLGISPRNPIFLSGKSQGQRGWSRLEGGRYSPWDRKELDTT